MKVILLKNIPGIGNEGDTINVKDGYARNYLLPKKLAVEATKQNLQLLLHKKTIEEIKRQKELRQAEHLKKKLKKVKITIPREAGEGEKLYGSVTSQDIAEALQKEGFSIEKRQIDLQEPIKTIGVYNIQINLHPEISTKIQVWVVAATK